MRIIKERFKTLRSKQGHYLNNIFLNERLRKVIDAIIIVWIVADIIILTAMYFVDMNNFHNAIIIFDTGICVVLFVQFVFKNFTILSEKIIYSAYLNKLIDI